MKSFFAPSAWGKDATALKFYSTKSSTQSIESQKDGKKKSKKDKNKKRTNHKNLASSDGEKSTTLNPKEPKTSGVLSGRITKAKNQKLNKKMRNIGDKADQLTTRSDNNQASGLGSKLKESLIGGRFRFINEQLYTMDSLEAVHFFNEDKEAFFAYHAGYRHQVEKWPFNPLDRIIKMIKKLPKSLVVGDFGCGEAKLAKSIPNKVFSIDIVSANDDVIPCDMCNTPLKAESLDVAVYCLSLMGTNLNDFLLEANRVLKIDGILYIAEVQTRFDDVQTFIKCLSGCGFKLIKKDTTAKIFFFFQFKKERNVGKVAILNPLTLKPCMYRKR